MIRKIVNTVAISLLFCVNLLAQDPQFSQFYAAPLYLNPGFTGTTIEHRFNLNHRLQWPALPQAFATYAFSYDYNMRKLNSGFGIMATTDRAGSADLRSTTVGLSYTYKIHMGDSWVVSPGIQFAYGIKSLDFDKLLFGDQLDFGDGNAPTLDPSFGSLGTNKYFDFSTGIVIYNKIFWAGISAHHLNKPNNSLIGEITELPTKISIHSGVRIPLFPSPLKGEQISSIAPSFVYKKQGDFDQLDVGLHFHYNPIMAGVWYRGIPIQQNIKDNISQDAIAVLFGLKFDKFDVGYSYDITVSELGPSTGGAHEISVMYQFSMAKKIKRKAQKFIPCPTF
ncbi:type IX secretion system membrane protein PorP/SprF [Fulvivirgaceae bacterium BMA10]|uniref:Type IX secretion system membrane protein PorP/SprF n=1 Tax=Splendidivirga corallicola TaxID=3051826 RepID=A0ABT8KRC0_9BACT|nr:type IX secretion system membrane protein PorP/SprF [Fulvivirgaceae bacterium BMA10]